MNEMDVETRRLLEGLLEKIVDISGRMREFAQDDLYVYLPLKPTIRCLDDVFNDLCGLLDPEDSK